MKGPARNWAPGGGGVASFLLIVVYCADTGNLTHFLLMDVEASRFDRGGKLG